MQTLIFFFPAFSFAQGIWTQKADFPGGARYYAAYFSIGTKGYIGLGSGGSINRGDFWEWNQETNVWTKKADFPGKSGFAVGFSIGTKGYVGIGIGNSEDDYINELWEYDPATDAWKQKASLPTVSGRIEAGGFSIDTKGYILVGMHCDILPEFWEWDQATDVWTQKANFISTALDGSVGFSIGDKGYICAGFSWCDDTPYQDFWEWDQKKNVWVQHDDFPGGLIPKVGFSFGNKGYILGMVDGYKNELWEWDQLTIEWTKKADFPGMARGGADCFSIGNKGYVGPGWYHLNEYDDFWEYDPSTITSIEDAVIEKSYFYPNPATGFITLNTSKTGNSDLILNIYNISGELINSEAILQNQQHINISGLSNGIYIVEIKTKGGFEKQKLIVQR